MTTNRLLELISRKLSGEATTEELREIDAIFSSDPAALERFKLLQQFWNEHDNTNFLHVDEAFDKLKLKLETSVDGDTELKTQRKRFFLRKAVAAAVIVIAGSLFLFTRYFNTGKKLAMIEKKNSAGVKSVFSLPDGTKVWLNAASAISFSEDFNNTQREIYLDGEAFFKVTKDSLKPFKIRLKSGTIEVLGTSFNVKAFHEDESIVASVATGKVAFIPGVKKQKKQDTVILVRDHKMQYLSGKEETIVEPTISAEDTAWIGGRIKFKATTFDEIGDELERNFGKKFTFLSEPLKNIRLTGSFRNNSLEEILLYLSMSASFSYEINDNDVLIRKSQ